MMTMVVLKKIGDIVVAAAADGLDEHAECETDLEIGVLLPLLMRND